MIASIMTSVLRPGKNLPPGLLLPMASEPTEQYLSENFVYKDLEPEDILDYGTLVVALATLSAD